MKECPNCGELIGDNAENCFNCQYNFLLKKVPNTEEKNKIENLQKEAKERQISRSHNFEKVKKEIELNYDETVLSNPFYEYKAETLWDDKGGILKPERLQKLLTEYASRGWRLHTMSTSVADSDSLGIAASGIGVANTTSYSLTTLIFERCIRPERYQTNF